MKVLLTGGAGYIGSVTTAAVIQAGHPVVIVDNLSLGHRAAVHPDAVFVEADLSDRQHTAAIIAEHRPDAIMHFAAYSLVGESMERPFKYLGANVTNGINLLEAAVRYGVRRFILSSTANLFDHPQRIPITEDEQLIPGSPYGESKFILERMLHWLDITSGLKHIALRYFNAAGATAERGEHHEPERHLIPLVLQVALGQRDNITIFGDDYDTPDGTCVRDYIHVADLASAHVLALEAVDRGSCCYNLGNGTGFSVKEVIETAREVTGHPIPTVVGARRPGDPAVLVAGSDRIRHDLGWKPKYTTLRSIVESAWNWHREHPHGYSAT